MRCNLCLVGLEAMKAKLLLLLIVLMIPLGIYAVFPEEQPRRNFTAKAVVGDSVEINYTVEDKTFHEFQYNLVDPNPASVDYVYWGADYSSMYAEDGVQWDFHINEPNNPSKFDFDILFKIASPYTSLTKVYWNTTFSCTGATSWQASTTIHIYKADGSATDSAVTEDWKDNLTLSSAYVVDGYIHGAFLLDGEDGDSNGDTANFLIDHLVFEYANVTETASSTLEYWEDGKERHSLAFTSFDYNVQASLDTPAGWTFHSVNPSCTRSGWVFSDTVPVTYLVVANTTDYMSLAIESSSFSFSDYYINAFIKPNVNCSYAIYENESLEGSGSIYVQGTSIQWVRNTTQGALILVGVRCTFQGSVVWVNTSYSNALPDDATLYMLDFGSDANLDEVRIWLTTSWRNTTVTIKDQYNGVNTTKFSAVAEASGIWTYEAPHESGNHTVFVEADGGADTLSRQFSYTWSWYVPTEPDDDIGAGPLVNQGLNQIMRNQFYQALIFGVALFVGLGVVAIWLRRERGSVFVDEKTGQILQKKRLKKRKLKVKSVTPHDRDKSTYEELEDLLEPDDL